MSMIILLATPLSAQAQNREAYVAQSADKTTLTFYYDALDFRRIEFGMNHSTSDQAKKKDGSRATINFSTSPQPLFHKNFDLLSKTLRDYLLQGYKLYIFADSEKQTVRLRDIFDSLSDTNVSSDSENLSVAELSREGQDATMGALPFTPVNRTLHEGFVDSTLKVCFFTDHQGVDPANGHWFQIDVDNHVLIASVVQPRFAA